MSRSARGFTLLELLVVMGILVVLVGLLLPGIRLARQRARMGEAKQTIQNVGLALQSYFGDHGDYPPSTLKDVGIPTNRLNDGIESLVACLATTRMSGPYFDFPDVYLQNYDGDSIPDFNHSFFDDRSGYEFTDPWGNPYIYFHNRDYERPGVASRYRFQDGKVQQAAPAKSKKKGVFHGFDSYQLWSAGPNGENENGGGDDIPSWQAN
jgi:prepilin-type N-terminal cleavage/methylation domain-containing protein